MTVLIAPSAWTELGVSYIDTVADAAVTSQNAASGEQWKHCYGQLLQIRRFPEDWDGMGALAPRPAIVDAALQFLKQLEREGRIPPPGSVGVSPLGPVVIEWQRPDGFWEAEIAEPGQVDWTTDGPEGTSHFTQYVGAHKNRAGEGAGWVSVEPIGQPSVR